MRREFKLMTVARGIAALWVVLYHFKERIPDAPDLLSSIYDSGYLAVDFFFVLSGFVITYNYLGQFESPSFVTVRSFLVRRLARIYPLHALVLVLYLIIPSLFYLSGRGYPDGYSVSYLISSIFLVQNWGFTDALQWNVPAWSISTEWFAYLMFPVISFAWIRMKNAWAPSVVCALVVLSLILLFRMTDSNSLGENIPHFGLFRCLLEFTAGSAIAVSTLRAGHRPQSYAKTALLIGVFCVSFAVLNPELDDVLAPLAFILIIYTMASLPERYDEFPGLSPFLYLGNISYSLYIFHYLLRDIFKIFLIDADSQPSYTLLIAYLICLIAISAVTHKWVELTCQRYVLRRLSHWA